MEDSIPRIDLSAGPTDYQDTGGDGPVLVLSHGVPMNHMQWRKVVPLLTSYRCILPTLPLGAHRRPMNRNADLSQHGGARRVVIRPRAIAGNSTSGTTATCGVNTPIRSTRSAMAPRAYLLGSKTERWSGPRSGPGR